jgi:tetratricopeptide (TPR) repeat protein
LLSAALDDALAGRASVVLVDGEPGIGKTWLLQELAAQAEGRGARVCWGRCWEGQGAPGYWPWLQVFRGYLRDHDAGRLARTLGPATGDLVGWIPELRERVGVPPPTAGAEPEQARFRLFDSIAQMLRSAAGERPLVLLLDDLHCADGDSLLLLEFVAAHLVDCRLLIVAARRSEQTGTPALTQAVTSLLRLPRTRCFTLAGLSEGDLVALLETFLARPAPQRLAAAVHDRTGGNPLFVAAMLPLLERWQESDGADLDLARLGVPDTVRKVIAGRIRQLPQTCRKLLEVASVIGREFDLALLGDASEMATPELMTALEPARRAIAIALDAHVAGRWRFAHVLVRDAVYEGLPAAERLVHHRRVGLALERRGADDAESRAAVAHHFLEAAPLGELDRAITFARRAAERAVGLHSYDAALRLLERALDALAAGSGDAELRCRLLLALGDALRMSGRLPEAREAYVRAADVAREIGSAEMLACSALGLAEPWTDFGSVDELRVRLLGEALAALGSEPTPLRLRVLARLAPALHGTGSHARMLEMVEESITGARQLPDRVTLLFALAAGHLTMRGPAFLEERKHFACEMRDVAAEVRDQEMSLRAYLLSLPDSLESGDLRTTERALDAAKRLARELRQPRYAWQVTTAQAALAILRGRFAEAESLAEEARSIGERGHVSLAALYHVGQILGLRRMQGRPAEILDLVARTGPTHPELDCIPIIWALVQLERGEADKSRMVLEREVDERLEALPHDIYWAFTMNLLAELCSGLEDVGRARRLYEMLAPYERRAIVLGTVALCDGSFAHPLGLLAVVAGRPESAERHFQVAIDANRRLEAWPALARTQHAYARLLLARRGSGDEGRAVALLDAAQRAAVELGMPSLACAVGRDRDRIAARGGQAVEPAPASNVFRLEGQYWSIAYSGRVVRLKRAKGLDYLASLLVRPGSEIHVLDLCGGASTDGRSTPAGDSADRQARDAYRRRLTDVRDELAEAELRNDLGRIDVLRREMEHLTEELVVGRGLGGRPRHRSSDSERARVSVRNDVTRALEVLRRLHPELWRHLSNAVRTGTFCSYNPERPTEWIV